MVWDEIPLAGWLIAFQQFVVMAHYLLMDSVHDFWHRGAWLFWAAKWLDIFINCAVIWGIVGRQCEAVFRGAETVTLGEVGFRATDEEASSASTPLPN